MKRYFFGILCGVSVLINALVGGEPIETVSYRSAKANRAGKRWGCVMCRFLDLFHRRHCRSSIRWHEGSLAAANYDWEVKHRKALTAADRQLRISFRRMQDQIAIKRALERR